MEPMTNGKYRVGISFNPSKNPDVAAIKKFAASLIDIIDSIEYDEHVTAREDWGGYQKAQEVARLKSLAMDAIEEGAMWAVKAATKQRPE